MGLPLDQVETTGESRDEPSSTSNEKSTQTSQPHVDEVCVSDEEPNADADVSMDNAEKSLRNSSTDPSDSKGLQDHAKEEQEAENESEGCAKEVDPGPHQSEALPTPRKQAEKNDNKKLSAGEDSKEIQLSATKRLITVEGKTYFVSKGMEKKFGFERKEHAGR